MNASFQGVNCPDAPLRYGQVGDPVGRSGEKLPHFQRFLLPEPFSSD